MDFLLFPYRLFFRLIWDTSERFKVGLGRFAPFVFEQMTGFKGEKINKKENKKC